ncbi:Mycothiol acetyltransferase [Microbacterium hydrocarbonoxydans]|uniref:Mycothiol acetyltransferase n=1 Tax=Microbacterium hydrocarbonoxydans TaxID=273678 RepID=A0A0M2HM69_9MICO|nr:GNAT family N-acetyltransferase [Microbacterium hydrocarbonoxydans]KJL47791.1 Mycothiol acetyltransferase [Microbacterium hydrocarbonoxydans]
MTVEVRRATPDDLSGVLGVFLGCWRESYRGILPAAVIEAMTDERARALWARALADEEGEVRVAEREVTILGLTRFVRAGDRGIVHSLYVSPQAHGGGVGRLLLTAAVDALTGAGARSAVLWVFAANAPSIGFYEAQGWRADGATRTQPEFGQPEQRMRRELP